MKNEYPKFDQRKAEFMKNVKAARAKSRRNLIAIIFLTLLILVPIVLELIKHGSR